MTLRNVRSMISMVKMLSRKEWVVEVVDMTHLIYFNHSSVVVETPLVVCLLHIFEVEFRFSLSAVFISAIIFSLQFF